MWSSVRRMVPFAGYSMPVQYPAGLMAEHHHTRTAAGLFDVSHMGQLRLVGADAAAAFETLIPVDVIGLQAGKQRYGLLLNDEGGIIDDLMFVNRGADLFVIVNGACKVGDIAHIQARIGQRCDVIPMPERALLALQGPQAVAALSRLVPGVEKLVFMTGGSSVGPAPTCSSRAAATPAKTDSKSRCTTTMPKRWRVPCWHNPRSSPWAWARATRCAWKPACACTATTSTPPPRRSRPP
jgi:glycine cleavage system aminomethyltransferase T